MSREIKFRAWKIKSKDMIDEINPCYLNSDKHEIMQYTGLKDKNGKEIYEGDIVQVVGNVLQFRRGVEYLPKYAQFGYIDNTGEWVSLKRMNEYNPHSEDTPRVIGNIYENPELLKEKAEQK